MNERNGMKLERAWLLAEKYGGVGTPEFLEDCKRLALEEPLAYLIGHIPFLDTVIFLDSRPLIPRPETEYWVARAIEEMQARAAPLGARTLSILDLCAGSGCVGMAVLKAVPMARVDFCEIDPRHHPTIAKNIRENSINPDRTRIFGGDLFAEIADAKRQYDFILANPPYLDPILVDRVDASVMEYEPPRALFGGTDGMEYIARIIKEAPRHLAQSGILYIEHEPEQTEWIQELAASCSYASCDTHPDQWQRDRYTRLVL